MAKINSHHASSVVKMLLIGDSGSGKTGSLISLVKAGYKLRVIDLDNGLDFLSLLIQQQTPKLAENVSFITLQDQFGTTRDGSIFPRTATAFSRACKMLDDWRDGEEQLGSVSSWENDTILVIDSLTFLSSAAMRFVMFLNNRLGAPAQQQDWGHAQEKILNYLSKLYSEEVKCNVIVTAHITYLAGEGGAIVRAYPDSLGQKLPPRIGRFFNTVFKVERRGTGANEKRFILTRSHGLLDLKAGAPSVPPELPIETGLAEYFKLQTSVGGQHAV